jgi:hypothetical protein
MARNSTLTRCLDKLRAELGDSLNPAHQNNVRDQHVLILQRVQERLWEEFAWPHMRIRRFIPLQDGARYYDPPSTMSIDRIENISVKDGGNWCPLEPGITEAHFSTWDSDADERSWPVRNWRVGEGEQIEVWPIPSQNGSTDPANRDGQLRVTGIKALAAFAAADDRADLDDTLITLYAAAELLKRKGSDDADLKLDQANKRYATLTGNLTPTRTLRLFGESKPVGKMLRGPPTVHYRTDP